MFLGTLGMSGQSAYWCIVDVLRPSPTDTLVVSGAAGYVLSFLLPNVRI